ncbi:MAG: hypothetical protein RL318_1913 [Fibrobacterota bacterium]
MAAPQGDSLRVWKEAEWGSESQFNPASMVLNEAWDIGQLEGHDRRLDRLWSGGNFRTLGATLSHPVQSVRRQGWTDFVTTEIVPTSLAKDRAQWIPNYQVHLLGGGFNNARLEDWYAAHGYERPALLACATTYASAILNEAAERYDQTSEHATDPIADLFLFDAASLVLFRLPGVRPFFTQTVQMMNWPLQPTLTLQGRAENAGQYWAIRTPLPWTQWRFLYHFGLGNIAGLSVPTQDGHWLSFAAGAHARRNVTVDSTRQTVEITPKAGVFLDQGGSLLASAFWNGHSADRFTVQVHPNRLTSWPVPWGFWLHGGGSSGWGIGLTTTIGLGAGLNL